MQSSHFRTSALSRQAAAIAFAVALFASRAPVASAQEPPTPPAEAELSALIDELDADSYDARERAMARLVRVGDAAIDPLTERLPDASREAVSRGLYILEKLALGEDEALANRARASIEKFVGDDAESALGRQASLTLDELNLRILKQTIERLRDFGAVVEVQLVHFGGYVREQVYSVRIDDAWTGTPQDFDLVRRLGRAEHVELYGAKIDDAALAAAASLEDVDTLSVKRASLTAAGFAELKKLDDLLVLTMVYARVGDAAIEPLTQLASVREVHLYGMNFSDDGVARVLDAFAKRGIKADLRAGGFLGVQGDATMEGAIVTDVVAESAAAKADLRPGDLIVSFEGNPVPDFATLTEGIAKFDVGTEVDFVVKRGGEPMDKKVTLGEWE